MSNIRDLTAELRAAREAHVRAERGYPQKGGPVAPPSTRFPWLQMLSVSELATHVKRLEQDLADVTNGEFPASASMNETQQTTMAQTELSDFNDMQAAHD